MKEFVEPEIKILMLSMEDILVESELPEEDDGLGWH